MFFPWFFPDRGNPDRPDNAPGKIKYDQEMFPGYMAMYTPPVSLEAGNRWEQPAYLSAFTSNAATLSLFLLKW